MGKAQQLTNTSPKMTNDDLPRLLNQIKQNTIKKLESADKTSLVYFDEDSSSVISIYRGDYEQFSIGLANAKDYRIWQEPYLISNLKFFKIERELPF